MRIHDGWELYCGKVVDRRSLGANGGKLTVPTIARVLHFFLLQRYLAVAARHSISRRGHTITAESRGMPVFLQSGRLPRCL
jgi:hypothetical protein